MQVQLEVAHDKANVRRVVLRKDAVIGRSSECNLRIASRGVSRQHCRIQITPTGVLVRDLGSANGTWLDGEKLEAGRDVAVVSGAELSLGGVRFLVRYQNPADQGNGPGSTVELPPDAATAPVNAAVEQQQRQVAVEALAKAHADPSDTLPDSEDAIPAEDEAPDDTIPAVAEAAAAVETEDATAADVADEAEIEDEEEHFELTVDDVDETESSDEEASFEEVDTADPAADDGGGKKKRGFGGLLGRFRKSRSKEEDSAADDDSPLDEETLDIQLDDDGYEVAADDEEQLADEDSDDEEAADAEMEAAEVEPEDDEEEASVSDDDIAGFLTDVEEPEPEGGDDELKNFLSQFGND